MQTNKRGFAFFSLICSALMLICTLAFALPGADAASAFIDRVYAVFRPQQDAGSVVGLNAPDAEPTAPRQDIVAAPLEEPDPAAPPSADDAETPADILQKQREYLAEYSGKTPAGTVTERFFEYDAATDVVGNVAVRNCTETQRPDFETLLNHGADLCVPDKAQPTVLIFHTHTTEGYLPADTGAFYNGYATRSSDPAESVVRVGEELCAVLRQCGVGCIHDTTVYDGTYDGAYARSRAGVQKLLEENPTVQIVLDVHRDAIRLTDTQACKPTAVIGGKKAAQIMVITGVQEGSVTDFPGWQANLRFALCLQQKAQDLYEGLMKPIYFCPRRYNMDLTPCSLLLEFGSDTNTLEEAVYSARLLGRALAELIDENA